MEKRHAVLELRMATWRMAMRDGYRGEDMYREQCFNNGVAAITYPSIAYTDLRQFSTEDPPPGWNGLESPQKGSINKFAWQIRGGDTLYVRDSAQPNLLIGCGQVLGASHKAAYYFDRRSPIRTMKGKVWCHLIPVDWESPFHKIPYKDRSANTAVLRLDEEELARFKREARRAQYKGAGFTKNDMELATEVEEAYPRVTPATVRVIVPRHKALSKSFRTWLMNVHGIRGYAERRQIDMEFHISRLPAMAEFKIAYDGNTKSAVREALGQILEYNHYPGRHKSNTWFLILDTKPSEDDILFVSELRSRLRFPIFLGWQLGSTFHFHSPSPLG